MRSVNNFGADRIGRQITEDGETMFVVRLYGYLLMQDNIERVRYLPSHFVARYLKGRKNRHCKNCKNVNRPHTGTCTVL